jgi:hypothetical protein
MRTNSPRSRIAVDHNTREHTNQKTKQGERKLSPLERGGTLSGAQAAGKDAGDRAKQMLSGEAAAKGTFLSIQDGRFVDDRWVNGRWDLSKFAGAAGETDWDLVIDAEMARRKLLEDTPVPSTNEDAVVFDTSEIPWWAWVRRFHLPVAEKLNGRACMVGYVLAAMVDGLTGAGLVEQQESFLGKLALHVVVFGILLIQSRADIDKYKNLIDGAAAGGVGARLFGGGGRGVWGVWLLCSVFRGVCEKRGRVFVMACAFFSKGGGACPSTTPRQPLDNKPSHPSPTTNTTTTNYPNQPTEATFYDSQWNAAWQGVPRPSETERA